LGLREEDFNFVRHRLFSFANRRVLVAAKLFVVALVAGIGSWPCLQAQSGRGDGKLAGKSTGFSLTQDEWSVPIVLVRSYPFVEAEVNGLKGKLMLDTGMEQELVINDHRVPLTEGTKTGTVYFGSGERFGVWNRPRIDNVVLAGQMRFEGLANVPRQNAVHWNTLRRTFWDGSGLTSGRGMR
jgi:hypothetical protein